MNIELSDKEFRRLLDMVYIGNWILNSARGEDRFIYENYRSGRAIPYDIPTVGYKNHVVNALRIWDA